MTTPATIFEFIKIQEALYDTQQVQIFDNYWWNMKAYIQMSVSFKNGQFIQGSNDYKIKNPFKNIVRPILNLRYRTEDIDVKDVKLYVDDHNNEHLSFLVKKYHDEVFVKENDLDAFFDEANEENIDFGGVLVQKTNMPKPEVLPLQSIGFCDQTDILGGPLGIKHSFSPDKLREMAKNGWGDTKNGATISIEELIMLADEKKDVFAVLGARKNITPGKNIETYIVMGTMPESYLKEDGDVEKYIRQVQVVAFYYSKNAEKHEGVVLYRKPEVESRLKFHTNKKIYLRALGEGGVEELFDAQIWTNFFEIHKKNMLEAASKVVLYTDDSAYANRNKLRDAENLEIMTIEDGKHINQVPTFSPERVKFFDASVNEWFQYAQLVGAAENAMLGKSEGGGIMAFRLQQAQVAQGQLNHDYRKGKFAKFVEEIYREWIIPEIVKEIVKGKKFLATLNMQEMQYISERLAENESNRITMEQVLNGEIPQDKAALKQSIIEEFHKGGNKRWIEILKGEFKDMPLAISINIANKQKNLVNMVDQITNILKFVFANPVAFQQGMQIPGMAQAFNDILEFSGISPVDFATMPPIHPVSSQPQQQLSPQMFQLMPPQQLPANQNNQVAPAMR